MKINSIGLGYLGLIFCFLIMNEGISSADEFDLDFVGHFGGSVTEVVVDGDYAYVRQGQDLVTLDISDKSNPSEVGRVTTPSTIEGIDIADGYAYLADYENGLVIVDIGNSSSPTLAGSYDRSSGYTYGVAVSDGYAYLVESSNGLTIVDISDPSVPIFASSYNTAGFAMDVAIVDGYAYIADNTNGLVVVDISNPSSPKLAGTYNTAGTATDVTVAENYAYIADDSDGLVIVDISNPLSPTLAGSYNTADRAWGVSVSGNYAYLADYRTGLVIVNITNPSLPILAGSIGYVPCAARDVAVTGNYAYIADYANGLIIVDISNPSSPTLARSSYTIGDAYSVAVADGYAYVADGFGRLAIVDISNPSSPTLAGSFDTHNALGVAVSGNYAYVADGVNGLVIVDISNPSLPKLAGIYNTPGSAKAVTVAGKYAYVADDNYNLAIVDISNLSSPKSVGYFGTGGSVCDIAFQGGYAYLANYENGYLVIVDVNNVSSPTLVGQYFTGGTPMSVVVADSYAYVTDLEKYNVSIVDISTPSSPTLVSSYYTAGDPRGIAVADGYAYVANDHTAGNDDKGLVVINISNPSAPTSAASYDTFGFEKDVAVADGYVYVADSRNGLVILRTNLQNEESYGSIELSSSPSEANIYLDGQLKGTTPATLTNIPVGSYSIKLTKNGYEEYTTGVTVLDGQTSTVSATLTIKNSYDVVWDTGLKVNPNGYRFYNFDQKVITWDLFKKSFNAQPVEYSDGTKMDISLNYYNTLIADSAFDGSCFGMASSSLILNENSLDAWDFNSENNAAPDNSIFMNLPKLCDWIEFYHIRQYSAPCIIDSAATLGDFTLVYESLKYQSPENYLKNPMILSIRWNDGANTYGHAVVPLRIEEDSVDNLANLYVYDSNDFSKEVKIVSNKNDKSVKCEDYNDNKPLTVRLRQLSSVKADGKIPTGLDNLHEFLVEANLLYTDSSGNRLGYFNDVFYDEIPGACRVVPLGNSTNNFSETYYLGNVSVTRKIISTGEGNVSFSTFKLDTFIGLDFYTKKDEISDLLISPSGSSIEFTSSKGTPYLNMTIIKGTEEYERLVNLDDLSIEQDSEFNLSISENLEEICITNNGSSKDYHLTIEQIGSNPGVYSSVIPVNVEEKTSTFITPVSWNALNDTMIRLEHDVGCDGTIDVIEIIDSTTINTETGIVTITARNGVLNNVSMVNESQIPSIPDADFAFGVFKFNVSDVSTGGKVNISMIWPEELFEPGCRIYGRYSDNTADHWYEIPSTVSKDNMTITVQLTDGGQGDSDLTANGEIVCNKGFAIVAYANVDDWNPWNDSDSEGGESIALSELQDAIYDWRFGIALSTGEMVNLTRLQDLIYSWRFGN